MRRHASVDVYDTQLGDALVVDLSYITDRIIAMGFPSEGGESMLRNPLSDVQKFFTCLHHNREMVFNLCSERVYKLDSAFPRCQRFPFVSLLSRRTEQGTKHPPLPPRARTTTRRLRSRWLPISVVPLGSGSLPTQIM